MSTIFKTAVQSLKEEFRAARTELTKAELITMEGFTKIAIKDHPEYDCPEGYKIIRSVWYGTSADLNLSRTMEKVRNELIG